MANDKRVAFLVAKEGIEQVELTEPWQAVTQAGASPRLVSVEPGTVQAYNHLDPADTFPVDETAADAEASAYSALVLPGGVANGDLLRWQEPAREFLRAFLATGRPVSARNVAGPTNFRAARVITTVTPWPCCTNELTSAAVLNAAMPPVTPTISSWGMGENVSR